MERNDTASFSNLAEQERNEAMNAGAIMEKLLRESTDSLGFFSDFLRSIADRLTDRLKVGARDRAWAEILTGLADEIDEVKTKTGDLQPQPASLPSASPEEK